MLNFDGLKSLHTSILQDPGVGSVTGPSLCVRKTQWRGSFSWANEGH